MQGCLDNDGNNVYELEAIIEEINEIFCDPNACGNVPWGDMVREKAKELNERDKTNKIASMPIALVAIGRTHRRGEQKRYALLLGETLPDETWPHNVDYFDLWDYVAMCFKQAGLIKEAIEDWSARQIAEWENWLPDPDWELLRHLQKEG